MSIRMRSSQAISTSKGIDMPLLIKTRDQIMRERQSDVHFLHFNLFGRELSAAAVTSGRQQLAWLREQGVAYEAAAPEGWLEGDPGCYAVYFDAGEDEQLTAYCAAFEDETGSSLSPDLYQMYLMPYVCWLRRSQSGSA